MTSKKQETKQYLLTPAAGKRLIAKALAACPAVLEALETKTVVILAGTTNGYAAEEILNQLDQGEGFSRRRFFRGITLPPGTTRTDTGRIADESPFPGDVVIRQGTWHKGKTIFDIVDELEEGDIIIKGANAVNLDTLQAAIYIGHPQGGTILAAMQAVVGRRVELYLPVGLEKRIPGDIHKLAQKLNSAGASGPRYFPVSGHVLTEIQALRTLTGADAELAAAGGVGGAEGSCWLAVSGSVDELQKAGDLLTSVGNEELFRL